MTKQQEINLIVKLNDKDSYFRDTFTEDDIDKMISNIQNDFPLLTGTFVDDQVAAKERAEMQVKTMEAGIAQRNNTIEDLEELLEEFKAWRNMALNTVMKDDDLEKARELWTVDELIEWKLDHGVALNQEEARRVKSRMID